MENWPAPQLEHVEEDVAEAVLEYLPAAQLAQAEAPEVEYLRAKRA